MFLSASQSRGRRHNSPRNSITHTMIGQSGMAALSGSQCNIKNNKDERTTCIVKEKSQDQDGS